MPLAPPSSPPTALSSSPSVRTILMRTLLLVLLWRGTLLLFCFLGMNLTVEFDFAKYLGDPSVINAGKVWQAFPDNYFLDGFFRFDSVWFDRIVRQGYALGEKYSNVAFFPLYPYLSRWLGYLTGNPFWAGLLISNLGLCGGFFYIYRIGLLFFDVATVERSIVLMLVFPTSFFFNMFYSEGLFLFLTTASFYYYLTRRYAWAGLWGMLANMTRFVGILLLCAYGCELLVGLWRRQVRLHPRLLWLLLIPLGLGIFMVVLQVQVGDPLAFIKAQSAWKRESTFPLLTLLQTVRDIDFSFPRGDRNVLKLLDLVMGLGFLVSAAMMGVRRYRLSLWLYAAFSILLPLATGRILSVGRFCAVIFPVFFYFGTLTRRPGVFSYWIFGSSLFLAVFVLRFMNWFVLL